MERVFDELKVVEMKVTIDIHAFHDHIEAAIGAKLTQ